MLPVNTQVVILAGGQGTRLGEFAKGRPKSMVLVRGRPFLEYQLELLKAQGIRDVVLCIGHLGEQIERYFGSGERLGLDIRYNLEDRPLGTAGALKNAELLLNDTFFTIYGDSYLFLDFRQVMSYFQSQKKLALMTVYRNHDNYDRSNAAIQGNLVKKYDKQERTPDMVYIDYGASIFRKGVLSLVPEDQFYRLEELFPRLIEREELLAFEVRERFYEVGSLQGLKDFQKYVGGQDDTLQSAD
jgi:NDP-sugar pyrophosphorylase family protein